MRRLVLAAVVLALGGVLAGPAAPSQRAPQLTCKYGVKYVTKVLHGHRKRVKVCKPKPRAKPQADLKLRLNGTLQQVTAGNHVAYALVVENDGPAIASDLTLSIDLPPGDAQLRGAGGTSPPECNAAEHPPSNHVECRFSDLAPDTDTGDGEVSSYVSMRVLLEPDTPGDYAASAKVTFASSTVDPHPADDSATKPLRVLAGPPAADLDVSVSSSPTPASVQDGFAETISVTNHGPSEATDVYVSLLLPQGATAIPQIQFDIEDFLFSGSLCPFYPFTLASASVVCFDAVGPGETQTATLRITPSIRSPGTLRTDAVVSSYTRDVSLGNNRASTETALEPFTPAPGPDLRLAFEPLQAFTAGKPLAVPFQLSNLGLGDVRSPTVSTTITPPLEGIAVALAVDQELECGPSTGGAVECRFDELPSDAHVAGALEAESARAGTYTATVTVASPDLPSPVRATTTFRVK